MGTALASFVAGALIVFTAFDETQVTRVDALQGSVKELRASVQSWQGDEGLGGTNTQLLEKTRTMISESMEESKKYSIYLEKESQKLLDKTNEGEEGYLLRKKDMVANAITSTKAAVTGLEDLKLRMDLIGTQVPDSMVRKIAMEAIPLTLQAKLDKTRMNSFELMSHLEERGQKARKSKEHYQQILTTMTGVNIKISYMKANSSLESLDKELGDIEGAMVPLTVQTPYTLLMMRIVEIGLPTLLSLLSIFFALRYSLTEKRSHEIKDLLRQRNNEKPKEGENAIESATT
jgi:hypothetical protein